MEWDHGPERGAGQGRITVRETIELPEVVAGDPELIAGSAGLDREVRWAHVVAGVDVVHLLDGGELVLTTGAGWPRDPGALKALARGLVEADPAAIVLEIGPDFAAPPPALIDTCERAGVPFIALRRETRFVQITQRLHQHLLASQTRALEARAEVHDMLTELGLNRSPVDYVVDRLSETLAAPVVLENPARQVVAWAGAGQNAGADEHPLTAWAAARDRGAAAHDAEPPAGWASVPVEAQGRRWGWLTALPGPAHPAGRRTVLELGAFALALGRLADPEGEQWLQLASKQLLGTLLDGRYRHEHDLAVQLDAAGLPVTGRVLIGATLRGIGDFGTTGPLERTVLETALRRAVAPEGRVLIAPDPEARHGLDPESSTAPPLLALLSFSPGDPLAGATPLAERLAHELDMLVPATTPAGWRAHLSLGPSGGQLRALIASLEQVRAAGTAGPSRRVGRVAVREAEQQPLAHLVRRLAAMPEVQEFVEETLGPLIEHDAGRDGDLLRVLEAYVKHPSNRSLAAQRARLSRSVFYQRLALIEQLLGVDLADGDTIATLSVALLAHA